MAPRRGIKPFSSARRSALKQRRSARRNAARRMGMASSTNILRTKRTWHKQPEEGALTSSWDIWWDAVSNQFINCKGVAHAFKLNDLPNYTEFTSLFDAYRFKGVKLEFVPIYNSHEINEGPASGLDDRLGMPLMTYARDYDDANAPTSEDTMLQYATNRRLQLSTRKSIYIASPRCASLVYKDGITPVGYSEAKANQWIDSANPDVLHYGLKYFLPVENLSKIVYIRVYATYYLEFKRVI